MKDKLMLKELKVDRYGIIIAYLVTYSYNTPP